MYYEYPYIETPSDETVIWRYMSFAKFMSILERNELYFSCATNQKDKTEGQYSDLTKRDIESSLEGINPNDENLPSVKNLISRLMSEPEKDKSQFFLSCWHNNEHESMNMWKKYVKNKEGICIKSNIGKLKESISHCVYPAVHIFETIYYNNDISKTPVVTDKRAVERFIYKREEFEHENEIRALAGAYSGDDDWFRHESVIEHNGIYVPISPKILIDKIYVCPKSPDWFLELLKSILIKYGLEDKQVIRSDLDIPEK